MTSHKVIAIWYTYKYWGSWGRARGWVCVYVCVGWVRKRKYHTGGTSEWWDEAHVGFPQHVDSILNWTELLWLCSCRGGDRLWCCFRVWRCWRARNCVRQFDWNYQPTIAWTSCKAAGRGQHLPSAFYPQLSTFHHSHAEVLSGCFSFMFVLIHAWWDIGATETEVGSSWRKSLARLCTWQWLEVVLVLLETSGNPKRSFDPTPHADSDDFCITTCRILYQNYIVRDESKTNVNHWKER